MDRLSQVIRSKRQAMGLSVAAAAQRAGLTKGYVSMIENDKVARPPSKASLTALEKALDMEAGTLLMMADWQNTPASVRA